MTHEGVSLIKDKNLHYYFPFFQGGISAQSLSKAPQDIKSQFREIYLSPTPDVSPHHPCPHQHPNGFSFSLGLFQQSGFCNPHERECQSWVWCQQNAPEGV